MTTMYKGLHSLYRAIRSFLTVQGYSPLSEHREPLPQGSLSYYREMMFRYNLALLVSFISINIVVNAYAQRWLLLGIEICIALIGVQSINAKIRGGRALATPILYVSLVSLLAIYALYTIGPRDLPWIFFCLPMVHFLLRRTAAWVMSLLIVLALAHFSLSHFSLNNTFVILQVAVGISLLMAWFVYILEKQDTALRRMAVVDHLTGAYNRRQFESDMARSRAQLERYGTPTSLLMLDLDYFKSINDEFGHDAGDRVLRRIAKLIESSTRAVDGLYRIGGEEFALILPNTQLQPAMAIAENIRSLIEGADIISDHPITASFGVAELHPQESYKKVIKRCDEALYTAKAEGRNRVVRLNAEELSG
ncbi:MAG: GGDEF domain-containing protein [Halieaceae bacterium]|jgi:diguanylate cyclase (GGDEF)-like protein|nr:GGDEF domain-containing protein [Halieaceae bacterium]